MSDELQAEVTAQAPRRSSRISARTKADVSAPVKNTRKPSKAQRQVEVEAVESNKKVKTTSNDDEAVNHTKDDNDGANVALRSVGPIDIGEVLPSITLKSEKGEDIDTGNIAAEKGIVLFLVPKADTPGCTTQACGFRDIWAEFTSLDYDIYGVSADTPTAQSKWQTKKQLPYPLISDPKRSLIGALGAADGNRTKRSHFVFEKGGRLLDKKMPVKPADSPRLALEYIKALKLANSS